MSKRIAIITARGGSKRIPNKNIREFCGKPILAYGIEAAIESGLYDEVMVSTDSEKIAEIGKNYGAKVPFMRSEHTSGDFATTVDVILEVINEYKKMGKEFDTITCIYPTAPFITADKLKAAVQLLEEKQMAKTFPVVAFSYPPQRAFVIKNDEAVMTNPEYIDTRSQDLEKMYHDAGQFYCFDTEKFIACNGRVLDKVAPIVVSELEVQDIDTETDWKLAELKYAMMK